MEREIVTLQLVAVKKKEVKNSRVADALYNNKHT